MDDLRVPVDRIPAELLLSDASRHSVVLFHVPGEGVESFLELADAFFPADVGGVFKLFSRRAVMVLSVSAGPGGIQLNDDELPRVKRQIGVELVGGSKLEGEVRYVVWGAGGRPGDFLNQPAKTFPLFCGDRVHHVVKAHVLHIEPK